MAELNETQRAIQTMFTENTGSHMLDSGGAYGRHHERNRALEDAGKTYLDLAPATVEFDVWRNRETGDLHASLDYTRQVCHWIEGQCEFRPDLQKDFEEFATSEELKDETWFRCLELWIEKKGAKLKYTENTYNGECALSQVVQYYCVEIEDSEGLDVNLAIVCLHQGCDVRGGYTKPWFFEAGEYLYGAADGYLRCSNQSEDHYWTTDDTCHWYWKGCCGPDFKNLEDYDFSDNPEDKGKGKVYVDDEKNGFCPLCGAKLVA